MALLADLTQSLETATLTWAAPQVWGLGWLSCLLDRSQQNEIGGVAMVMACDRAQVICPLRPLDCAKVGTC